MNSLKVLNRFFWGLSISFLGFNTQCQELINHNLFYCHENIELKYLWPVGNGQFVTNVRYLETKKIPGQEMYLSNMFLLFDKSHIVTDTVYISNLGRSVNVLDEKTILFTSKFGSKTFDISNGKFDLIKNDRNPDILKLVAEEKNNRYMLGTFNGVEIGYLSKAKNRTLKRSKKNIPRYFYLDNEGNQVFINSGKEKIVGGSMGVIY